MDAVSVCSVSQRFVSFRFVSFVVCNSLPLVQRAVSATGSKCNDWRTPVSTCVLLQSLFQFRVQITLGSGPWQVYRYTQELLAKTSRKHPLIFSP